MRGPPPPRATYLQPAPVSTNHKRRYNFLTSTRKVGVWGGERDPVAKHKISLPCLHFSGRASGGHAHQPRGHQSPHSHVLGPREEKGGRDRRRRQPQSKLCPRTVELEYFVRSCQSSVFSLCTAVSRRYSAVKATSRPA